MLTLSVSQLNRYVKAVLEENSKLTDLYLKGEVTNFKGNYRSGHLYFSLADELASVRAVMFQSYARHLSFQPEDGVEVVARGHAGLYEADGSFQFYVTDMVASGAGVGSQTMKKRLEKLRGQGYFEQERKKDLPEFPRTIGVVTSKSGAALHDILAVLGRRYPFAHVRFVPVNVQGSGAAQQIAHAVKRLDGNCDVMIVTRGGGSKEDLAVFNEEVIADAVFASVTPVISAVGHEIDVTICDLVADLRAPTPSAAAEIATPSVADMQMALQQKKKDILYLAKRLLAQYRADLMRQGDMLKNMHPAKRLHENKKRLDFCYSSMYNNYRSQFRSLQQQLCEKAKLLESLNPFAVLGRGYVAVIKDSRPVTSAQALSAGDQVVLKFCDGEVGASIE